MLATIPNPEPFADRKTTAVTKSSGAALRPTGVWPRKLVTSVLGREVIVVQSLILVILMMILVMNFFMDIAYVLLDPRIRDSQGGEAIV